MVFGENNISPRLHCVRHPLDASGVFKGLHETLFAVVDGATSDPNLPPVGNPESIQPLPFASCEYCGCETGWRALTSSRANTFRQHRQTYSEKTRIFYPSDAS